MFSVITSKIFAGASLFLLLALVGMGIALRHEHHTVEAQRNTIADMSARAHVQDAAIAAAGEEAQRQRQAYADAVASGQQAIAAAQGRVTVVRTTTHNGCPTPPQIMGAGL